MDRKNNRRPFEDPLTLFSKALIKLYSIWLRLTYPFASLGRDVSFHFTSIVYRPRTPRISIGNSSSLREYAWLNVSNDDPTGEPVIVLEDNCHIGFGSIISAKNRIHLERDVLVGQFVLIIDHNHAYEDITAPVLEQGLTPGGTIRIGQGSWIGRGSSVICPRGELTIGRNCVIAANSTVMRSIPDNCVVAGYPATIIRQYDPETRTWRIGRNGGRVARNAESFAQTSEMHSKGIGLGEDFAVVK